MDNRVFQSNERGDFWVHFLKEVAVVTFVTMIVIFEALLSYSVLWRIYLTNFFNHGCCRMIKEEAV